MVAESRHRRKPARERSSRESAVDGPGSIAPPDPTHHARAMLWRLYQAERPRRMLGTLGSNQIQLTSPLRSLQTCAGTEREVLGVVENDAELPLWELKPVPSAFLHFK